MAFEDIDIDDERDEPPGPDEPILDEDDPEEEWERREEERQIEESIRKQEEDERDLDRVIGEIIELDRNRRGE